MRGLNTWALLQLLLVCMFVRHLDARSIQQPSANPQRFLIAHINDVHNRIEQASSSLSTCSDNDAAGKCVGGYGRISTAIRGFRRAAQQQKAPFYFLNAGDEFLGTLWDQLYKGQATAQVQRTIGSVRPNVQVLGNHEFDFGPEKLADYMQNATHRFAVCNVNASAVPRLARMLQPFRWLAHPKLKIAVVGWTTPDTAFLSSPGAVTFSPIIDSLTPVIRELQRRKADIIIGLSHAGYDSDLQVAAAVPGLDLIVGGHSHTFLANSGSAPLVDTSTNATDTPAGPYPTYVNASTTQNPQKRIPIVQAFYGSKYIGLLKLSWTKAAGLQVDDGSGPVLLGSTSSSNPVAQDPAVAAVIAPLKPAVDALRTQMIGSTQVDLDGVRENVRSRETNLANLIADSMLQSIKQLPGFESQFGDTFIAIQNGGGVRASIAAGNVTQEQVITVLPFGNVVSVVRVNGSALVQAIQSSLQGFPGQGRFAQVSGMRYFHSNGTFLSAFLLRNSSQLPIDPAASYNVVTNNFMAAGGDGYTALQAGQQIYPLGPPQDQVLAAMFTSAPNGVLVAPQVEGRIINCGIINCSTEQRDFVKAGCSCT